MLHNRFCGTAALTLLLVLSSCGAIQRREISAPLDHTGDSRCQVVVLGVVHEYFGEGYRPAHLRAFYDAVQPTALAIEHVPLQHGREELELPLNENYEAIAYGRAHEVPVYGVDWDYKIVPVTAQRPLTAPPPPPAALSPAEVRRLRLQRGWAHSIYKRIMYSNSPRALELLNSPGVQELLGTFPDAAPGWAEINDSIAENIRAVARQCRGGRLVVTYGALHKPLLDAALENAPEVRLRQPTEWFPMTKDQVARHDRPEDFYDVIVPVTESLETLFYPGALARSWLRSQEPWMQELAADDLSARYYLARWLTLEGKWDAALTLLREVSEQAVNEELFTGNPAVYRTVWFWPPERSLRRRALFAQALVHDLKGERESALAIYSALKREITEQQRTGEERGDAPRLLPWLELFLVEPYADRPDQYLRVLIPG